MKIQMMKMPGGALQPINDIEAERMTRFKNLQTYEIDIKVAQNPKFRGKVFSFLHFCFQYWKKSNGYETEIKQFDIFRAELTIQAGYYDSYYRLDGSVKVEAKSLAYENMPPEEFEQFYPALFNAASKHIFQGADQQTIDLLYTYI